MDKFTDILPKLCTAVSSAPFYTASTFTCGSSSVFILTVYKSFHHRTCWNIVHRFWEFLYTSQKKKHNTWCRLTHYNPHCRLSFVSIGPLHGRRHLKFAARRRFPTVWSLIPSWCKPGLAHCVHIVLPSNGLGRHACFKHSNCMSTVDNRESWHRCRDREHKINLGFLCLAELTTKQQKKFLD